jgi:hypothetical protein
VHPAGRAELTHGGVDERVARAAVAPRREVPLVVVPREAIGRGLERAVHRDARESVEDVLVELAPHELVDPLRGARRAAVDAAVVRVERGPQALTQGEHAAGQIGRQRARAGEVRSVAIVVVANEAIAHERLQSTTGGLLAGGPLLARHRGDEAVQPRRHRVGSAHHLRLRAWRRERLRPRRVVGEGAAPRLSEGRVHGVEAVRPGAQLAGLENALVGERAHGEARLLEGLGDGGVAPALVHLVLAVEEEGVALERAGEGEERVGHVVERVRVEDAQGDVPPGERLAERGEVAEDEVDLGRSRVVPPVLAGAGGVRCDDPPVRVAGGGVQGGVVGGAEVRAEPGQDAHRSAPAGVTPISRRRARADTVISTRSPSDIRSTCFSIMAMR